MDNETKVITPLRKMHQCLIHSNLCLCQKTSQNETLPEEEEVLPDPKRKDRKMVADPISYSCCLGIGTAVFFASGGRGEVVVPDVSDLSEASARNTRKAKLEVATKQKKLQMTNRRR